MRLKDIELAISVTPFDWALKIVATSLFNWYNIIINPVNFDINASPKLRFWGLYLAQPSF